MTQTGADYRRPYCLLINQSALFCARLRFPRMGNLFYRFFPETKDE